MTEEKPQMRTASATTNVEEKNVSETMITETTEVVVELRTNPWTASEEVKNKLPRLTTSFKLENLPSEPVQSISDPFSPLNSKEGRSTIDFGNNYVRCCKWSASGNYLLTDAADHRIRVFPCENSRLEPMKMGIVGQGTIIYDLEWHPTLDVFASTSKAHPIKIFDSSCQELATAICRNHVDEIDAAYSLAFSNNGETLFAGFKNLIYVFNLQSASEQSSVIKTCDKSGIGQRGMISCMAMNPVFHGSFAAGSYNSSIGLYSEQTGSVDMMFETTAKNVTHIKFSSDGTKLFYGCAKSSKLECVDVRFSYKPLKTFERPVNTNQTIYFDVDSAGNFLFTGTTDNCILIYDLNKEGDPWKIPVNSRVTAGLELKPGEKVVTTSHGERIFPLPKFEDDDENEEPVIPDFGVKLWEFN
uniref:Uncharacterized protein n=1 Tax=Panagrolaimus sp. JU765 TaxID=591449 RepID=A0AC34Q9S8_9BILA